MKIKWLLCLLTLIMLNSYVIAYEGNIDESDLGSRGKTILQAIKKVEKELGITIIIKDGKRPIYQQAELMADMSNSQLNNLYKSEAWYVIKMKECDFSGEKRIEYFKELIIQARNKGSYVSRHIDGDAIDISPNVNSVRKALERKGINIEDETSSDISCWHLY